MNLGVLLLHCTEPRSTTFTRRWADQAVARVAEYLFVQSGGSEAITHRVFDWIGLPMTEAAWINLGFGAIQSPQVKQVLDQEIGPNALAPFTHILVGIDTPSASGGATPGTLTHLAAQNFTPALISHELGHRFGADDAFVETPNGNVRYQDPFCVMGAQPFPRSFVDSTIADPVAAGLNLSGPCMCVPTLLATPWLDEKAQGLIDDVTGAGAVFHGGVSAELQAVAGVPGPGDQPPLAIRYGDLLIEYRVAVPGGWDQGLPDPGGNAGGWIVAHRSPVDSPSATFVASMAAVPGAVHVFGDDNPLDIFHAGPLRVSVVSFDADAHTVRLSLTRRAARPLPSATPSVGVAVGTGGMVWTPGRGFTPVPPHSPLLAVIGAVARIQDVHDTMAVAAPAELPPLREAAAGALRELQHRVAEVPAEPGAPPVERALEGLSELEAMITRLAESPANGATGAFVAASRRRLGEVERILAEAVAADGAAGAGA